MELRFSGRPARSSNCTDVTAKLQTSSNNSNIYLIIHQITEPQKQVLSVLNTYFIAQLYGFVSQKFLQQK
jgi:hypothetical protein